MDENISIIFIAGNKRSGSTHIARLLNTHNRVFISNETDILWILYCFHNDRTIEAYPRDSPKGMRRALDSCGHVLSKNNSPLQNFVEFQKEAMKEGLGHMGSMEKENLQYLGDQKPYQCADPELLVFAKDHFPNVRIIHPVRHPFAQIYSAMTFEGDGGYIWRDMTKKDLLKYWVVHENWIMREKEKNDIPIIDVRLEDLTDKPATELSHILDFLDLEYDKKLLEEAKNMTWNLCSVYENDVGGYGEGEIMEIYNYNKNVSPLLNSEKVVYFVNLMRRAKNKLLGDYRFAARRLERHY